MKTFIEHLEKNSNPNVIVSSLFIFLNRYLELPVVEFVYSLRKDSYFSIELGIKIYDELMKIKWNEITTDEQCLYMVRNAYMHARNRQYLHSHFCEVPNDVCTKYENAKDDTEKETIIQELADFDSTNKGPKINLSNDPLPTEISTIIDTQ
ncbi:4353_t:CDS:2, partial [Dentiscutata erythropus]